MQLEDLRSRIRLRLRQTFGRPTGASRRRGLSRRRAGRFLLAAAVLGVAGIGWIVLTGLTARAELLATQRALETLRQSFTSTAGGSAATTAAPTVDTGTAMRKAAAHSERAHRLTTGPVWYLAAQMPVIGRPLETVRHATHATDRLTHEVLPPLVRIAPELAGGAHKGGVHALLSALGGKTTELTRAARAAAEVRAETERVPHSTWLPAVDRARAALEHQLERIAPATADVAVAARLLPPMLGEHQPRRYFVVFQNTAEARGTGGLPGGFAVLTARQGRLSFETFGNDSLLGYTYPKVDLGAEYTAQWGGHAPTRFWGNTNLSPHFPYAARIWSAYWLKYRGQRVDGVVALDPSALGRLLRATGPARLPDGTMLSESNALDLTERTGYARYANVPQRKAFFLDVARTAASTLMEATDDPRRFPALLSAVRDGLKEERLKMWSARPGEQRLLETRPLSGTLPTADGPFAGLVVNNAAGSKLDYYLDRQLHWIPGQCTGDGRSVTAQITLTSRAPTSGLPFYVVQRVDAPSYRTRHGDNRLLVSYYAGAGAQLTGATLDGRPVNMQSGVERGHSVYTLDLELPAQRSRTLTLRLLQPPGDRVPAVLRQPLVTPLLAKVEPYPPCGA